jgi:ABC-type glycerol-3-phosphate transport system substrate-binding protein
MSRKATITIIIVFIFIVFTVYSCRTFREKPTVVIRVVYPDYFYCEGKYANISKRIKEQLSHIEVKFIPRRVEEYYRAAFEKLHLFEFAPDVIIAPAEVLPSLVEKELLVPLDNFISEDDFFDIDDYNPKAVEMFKYRDSLWMIPRNIKFSFIIYNESLLKKCGIKIPQEHSSFSLAKFKKVLNEISECGEIVKNNYIIYLSNIYPLFMSFVGYDVNEINKDNIITFITFLREIMKQGTVCLEPLSEKDLLLNEKVAVFIDNFHAAVLKSKLLNKKYNLSLLFGGKTLLSSDGVGIAKKSKHKWVSWEVAKILTSEVGLQDFYEYELPANEILYENFISNAEYGQLLRWVKCGVLPLKHKNYNKILHLINTELVSISKSDKKDITKKCIQLCNKIRRILKYPVDAK